MSHLSSVRLYTRALSGRALGGSRPARNDLVVIPTVVTPRVWNTSRSPGLGLAQFYSTSSKEASNKGYTAEILLALTAGLAVASGVYNARRNTTEPSNAKPVSTAFNTNYASPEELQLAIQELRKTFPDKHLVETDPEIVRFYGSSENSYHPTSPHSVVVRVHGTEDVVKVVNISRKYRVPVTAYSGATSLEGHYGGVRGQSI
jgi:D-lactate dehydrogenase (cytochrome)